MNKVIALVGVISDPVLVYVAHNLAQAGLPLVWLNQDLMGKSLFCSNEGWSQSDAGGVAWQVKHSDIVGVYSRVAGLDYQQASKSQVANFEILSYLLDWIYPLVINRPRHCLTNFSKLAQLISLADYGFLIPKSSLKANTPHCQQPSIYKSASGVRSIVKRHTQLSESGAEPVLYQQLISGDNVRVHVFNGDCYAVRVKSYLIDYRYCDASQFKSIKLPARVAKICIEITRGLELSLSGIDLILAQGKWYILEVNPSPGFNFFVEKVKDYGLVLALSAHFKNLI